MIHATTYSDNTGFIELVNCCDDNGKPVIYAKSFAYVANMQPHSGLSALQQMQQAALELQTVYNAGIVWHYEALEQLA